MEIFGRSQIAGQTEFWKVLATTAKSQVAVMVLGPGQTSGKYGTDHPQADQVLYCVSGSGEIECEGARREIREGEAALIRAGARHQVRGGPMVSLNFYGPAAYPDE